MASRKKNFAINVRMDDVLKAAVEKAAQEDTRTVTSYVEKLIVDDLKAKGLMPKRK